MSENETSQNHCQCVPKSDGSSSQQVQGLCHIVWCLSVCLLSVDVDNRCRSDAGGSSIGGWGLGGDDIDLEPPMYQHVLYCPCIVHMDSAC